MLKKYKTEGRAAFIPYMVAGFPNLLESEKAIDALVEEGADLLELGVPFSDATADGPVIQAASEKAAHILPSMPEVLAFAAKISKKHPTLPLIIFTYFNPLIQMGLENFVETAKKSGVSAVLIVDLPPEESAEVLRVARAGDLKTIFLASPTTTDSRIQQIAEASTGFMYYVSRTGVTGVQAELSKSLGRELENIRRLTSVDVAVGFGISNGIQAREVACMADAVVVGSAFVKIMSENVSSQQRTQRVRALAREISSAVREARSVKSGG